MEKEVDECSENLWHDFMLNKVEKDVMLHKVNLSTFLNANLILKEESFLKVMESMSGVRVQKSLGMPSLWRLRIEAQVDAVGQTPTDISVSAEKKFVSDLHDSTDTQAQVSIFFDVLFILQHYVLYPAWKTVTSRDVDATGKELLLKTSDDENKEDV